MKTLILFLVFLLSANFISAQYRSYKGNYNIKTYTYEETDRYNPGVAGALAIIPGVGHFYDGEPGRGFLFIGGMAGSFGVFVGGFAILWSDNVYREIIGSVIAFSGVGGLAFFYVWNIIDAVKVAKIKNMRLRDKNISFKIKPYFESGFQNRLFANNAGLSLKINF